MSTLYTRKDSSYWYYTRGGRKNRVQMSLGTRNKKEAEKFREELDRRLDERDFNKKINKLLKKLESNP